MFERQANGASEPASKRLRKQKDWERRRAELEPPSARALELYKQNGDASRQARGDLDTISNGVERRYPQRNLPPKPTPQTHPLPAKPHLRAAERQNIEACSAAQQTGYANPHDGLTRHQRPY